MTCAAVTAWPPALMEAASSRRLPWAGNILAVTARPGQESASLGRLLYAFRRRGASLALLTLTRGEASPLNSTCERLEVIRPWELQVAAGLLGISWLMVADYPDGGLNRCSAAELAERVRRAIRTHAADLVLVIEPTGGDPDDAAVARAAGAAAEQTGVPALARMPRADRGGWHVDLGADVAPARAVQRAALASHASQAQVQARPQAHTRPRTQHWMDGQDGCEHLRWLVPPRQVPTRLSPL